MSVSSIGPYVPAPSRYGVGRPASLDSVLRFTTAVGSAGLTAATGGIGPALGQVLGGTLGSTGGLDGVGRLEDLMRVQLEAQQQMQVFTMRSNLQKTEHEARMAPVRNMRA